MNPLRLKLTGRGAGRGMTVIAKTLGDLEEALGEASAVAIKLVQQYGAESQQIEAASNNSAIQHILLEFQFA